MKLNREIKQWEICVPADMARMSEAAIMYALSDARSDILSLHAELIMARASEQAALDRAAGARLDFQREFHGQLQEAIAAEREACAHIVECKALCRAEAAAKIRGRSAT